MPTLTDEAKTYLAELFEARGREEITTELESICIAVYDEDDLVDDLIPCAIDSVEAGDIDVEFSMAESKFHHSAYMAWLDIEEVWND